MTGPAGAGSRVNTTPFAVRRSNSLWTSVTSNAASGILREHNRLLPHSAFRGQTPDEMSFGTGDAVPADLTARAAVARRARVEAQPIRGLRDVPVDQRGRLTSGR